MGRERILGGRGFTLVELLVVMAVMAVLVALLLPAVQAAREAGRRIMCCNHIKQLGLACHAFHDAYRVTPPSRVMGGGFPALNVPPGAYGGWAVYLLPYLEQSVVADRYDRRLHFAHADNQVAIRSRISVFHCPSTPNGNRVAPTFMATGGGPWPPVIDAAVADYSVIRQVDSNLWSSFPELVAASTQQNPIGPFSYSSGNTIREMNWAAVLDGLSNTFSYLEVAGRGDRYTTARVKVNGTYQGSAWADDRNEFGVNGCVVGDVPNIRPGPSPMNCTNDGEAYSFHPGGINVSMCDGSVRFVSETIAMTVFAGLVTAQGGEILSDY